MPFMDKHPPHILTSLFRGGRLALHLFYAALLAIFYPHLKPAKRRRILKTWSRQLLDILNIGIRTEGQWTVRAEGGYLVVANHVSWMDIFVLNAIYPSRFIAKAEVRNWPFIGWLCKRGNTIFIERAMRRDAASINQHVSFLLKQGVCVGLFPEGTTTDGRQVGHFHSALIQPAIDAGAMLCPVALRYQDKEGEQSNAAVFAGDMTLSSSIWRILRSPRFDALLALTPILATTGENRRALARAAQQAIAQELLHIAAMRQDQEPAARHAPPQAMLSLQSGYALLLDPMLNNRPE